MEIVLGLLILAAFAAFLIYRARKIATPPGGAVEPHRAPTPEEVQAYWEAKRREESGE